ncbi:glycosyltransferase family 4 protein [Mycobacterium sp. TNTM28]|uniref:Glycosyltransferase family 4 protein n=1 Tax=[Mycobacterium] fortunisiensis TaxID=2600579 RepID=A0ABS6KGM6_9MYCO|nr:glycosyltransferase family 4 protein [[Mycobacterium] fortunisiensis]MBU9762715.1 glycosyltransferase family 4 protein [[Mycobacterium] fortunisiensis]
MTGSEWFSAMPGGLNRYFTDLFTALRCRTDLDLSATAFGSPPTGGQSWGDTGGSTWSRVTAAFTDRTGLAPAGVLDRHFCLYGPAAIDRSRRRPLVVHFHGPWAAESRFAGTTELRARAKYLVERIRYAGAQRFVVLSSHFRDVLIEDYRVPADRIEVIPPGVDLDRFAGLPKPDVPDHRRIVLCVRRLEHRMGIHRLIEAWPAVTAAHADAHLVIVGTGTAENDLRRQVTAAGLDQDIEFLGRIEDSALARWYSRAELTVVPSIALEGFGLIALESLATGRPAVVSDCGGLPDAVRDLDPTLVVPADNAEALATRLVAALDGALPSPLRCRAHAETFSWAVAAQRHHTLYQGLAA